MELVYKTRQCCQLPPPLTEDVHVLAPDLGVVVREVCADLAAVEARAEQRHPGQDHRHAPSQELKQVNLNIRYNHSNSLESPLLYIYIIGVGM